MGRLLGGNRRTTRPSSPRLEMYEDQGRVPAGRSGLLIAPRSTGQARLCSMTAASPAEGAAKEQQTRRGARASPPRRKETCGIVHGRASAGRRRKKVIPGGARARAKAPVPPREGYSLTGNSAGGDGSVRLNTSSVRSAKDSLPRGYLGASPLGRVPSPSQFKLGLSGRVDDGQDDGKPNLDEEFAEKGGDRRRPFRHSQDRQR